MVRSFPKLRVSLHAQPATVSLLVCCALRYLMSSR
jgi:hypothetical protein